MISLNSLPASPSGAAYIAGANYVSPELPEDYMRGLIGWLAQQPGYTVQVNKPYAQYRGLVG